MEIKNLPLKYSIHELSNLLFLSNIPLVEWDFLKQCRLANKTFGEGQITSIIGCEDNELTVFMTFFEGEEHQEKRFLNKAFTSGFFFLLGHPDFPEQTNKSLWGLYEKWKVEYDSIQKAIEEQAKREEEERNKKIREAEMRQVENEQQALREIHDKVVFRRLKNKYDIRFNEDSPTSLLYMILLKLDNGEDLNEEDIKWLEVHNLYILLGTFFENKFAQNTSDIWTLVRAISYWRKDGNPEHALNISNNVVSEDIKKQSALLTSRGGAFRDRKEFDIAKQNAENAIKLTPMNYHPYNLLGAIHYQTGKPEEADKYFARAIELGSSPKEIDDQIRKSIEMAEVDQRRLVAKYLISKDPIKYEWAKHYL